MTDERKAKIRELVADYQLVGTADLSILSQEGGKLATAVSAFKKAEQALIQELGREAIAIDGRVYMATMDADYETNLIDRPVTIL